jgi:hypothetical protein
MSTQFNHQPKVMNKINLVVNNPNFKLLLISLSSHDIKIQVSN